MRTAGTVGATGTMRDAGVGHAAGDDRVLPEVRAVAAFIVGVLVLALVMFCDRRRC
jgi:hypothetical protein